MLVVLPFNTASQQRDRWYGRITGPAEENQLVSIPTSATEEQIRALISLLKTC